MSEADIGWLGVVLSILGIFVTIVGLMIAVAQIRKTQSAKDATSETAQSGTKRIRSNQLLILAQQLASLEPEMDAAVSREDRFAAERALVRWRQLATQAAGMLREIDGRHENVADQLDTSCNSARSAKARLPDTANPESGKAVASVLTAVRKDMAIASDALTGVVSQMSTEVEGGLQNGK